MKKSTKTTTTVKRQMKRAGFSASNAADINDTFARLGVLSIRLGGKRLKVTPANNKIAERRKEKRN